MTDGGTATAEGGPVVTGAHPAATSDGTAVANPEAVAPDGAGAAPTAGAEPLSGAAVTDEGAAVVAAPRAVVP
ncbi:hypothetical protein ACIRQY_02635 [Streptomyces sp. NPDC101490]|uniref:hypothetical protein n=1 Tax=Streptomyces sp. NPDC101490 TaxID=3366143 RepID=UPI003820CDA6